MYVLNKCFVFLHSSIFGQCFFRSFFTPHNCLRTRQDFRTGLPFAPFWERVTSQWVHPAGFGPKAGLELTIFQFLKSCLNPGHYRTLPPLPPPRAIAVVPPPNPLLTPHWYQHPTPITANAPPLTKLRIVLGEIEGEGISGMFAAWVIYKNNKSLKEIKSKN